MKSACIILTILIAVAIMAVCVMVKLATEITVEERRRDLMLLNDGGGGDRFQLKGSMGVISLDNTEAANRVAARFPYVAAVIRNSSSSWSFACFASLILVKWVVTSAHCRSSNSTHRVLLYYDYTKHYSETYAVLFWRLHEQYNISKPSHKYDIAVAKINMENRNSLAPKAAVFDSQRVTDIEASLWKTVMSIDRKIYLTNDFHMYKLKIESSGKCFQSYGVEISEDLICIDLSEHDEMCFVHEFGPIYNQDKVVGVLAVKPAACDTKVAVFTNVSYYSNWITKSTLTTYYG